MSDDPNSPIPPDFHDDTDAASEALLSDQYPQPLPEDGDRFFVIDPDQSRVALHNTYRRAMTYINGYMWAAQSLYEKAKASAQEAREKQGQRWAPMNLEHWLVYPIYFLHRHSIELSLKDILRTGISSLNEKQQKAITRTHDVYALWEMAKPWVMTFAEEQLKDYTAAFESMLKEIKTYDPNADAGRYHTDKTLGAAFEGISPIDVKVMHESSIKILNYITTIWTMYAEVAEFKAITLEQPNVDEFIARWLKEDEE